MEQLKRINILRHPDQRDIETECVINNLFQRIGRNILAKERGQEASQCSRCYFR